MKENPAKETILQKIKNTVTTKKIHINWKQQRKRTSVNRSVAQEHPVALKHKK